MVTNIKKRLHIQLLAALIPASIIIGLIFIPSLFRTNTKLSPLQYRTTEQLQAKDSFTVHGSFQQDLPPYESLWLYAENAKVTVTISGKHYRFNEYGSTPSIFRSPGSGWYSILSPGIRQGEPVEFTICSYYNEHSRAAGLLLNRLYMGDGNGFLGLMLEQVHFFSIVLIFALIAGIIYIVEGSIDVALGMTAEGKRIALFGFYCFAGGLWGVTDVFYPYLTLIFSPPWAAMFADMAGLLLFPIALAMMIHYYIRGKRTSHLMTVVLFAEISTAILCLLFQFIGRIDLMEQQYVIGLVALIALGTAMICIILELHRYRDNYLLLLFFTILPVFLSEIIDGINLLWPFMSRRILMQYSFGLSILLLVLQFISYANTELSKSEAMHHMENELENSRISIMLSQIQPHFLYNSLLGIKVLCDTDPPRASEALEHFSFYLRGNLDSLTAMHLVSFDKELVHMRDYLYLEKMRFAEELNIQWELAYTDFLLPPLTVQPMIENAIRHGLNKKIGGGTLTIQSERTADCVIITIQDTGVGFDPAAPIADGRSHVGIDNTRKRLEALCGGSLLIKSSKQIGTTACIYLPQQMEGDGHERRILPDWRSQ